METALPGSVNGEITETTCCVNRIRAEVGPALILLTGTRGTGKTRWCRELIHAARAAGLAVAGLVSPPVYAAGCRTAIDLVDLATDELLRLAVVVVRPELLQAARERWPWAARVYKMKG